MLSTRSPLLAVLAVWCGCSNAGPGPRADPVSPLPDAASGDAALPDVQSEADASACIHSEVTADCQDGWCRIPAGCFIKGSPPDEYGRGRYSETQVQVTLTHSFLIQQHEMTQAEWTALGLANPSTAKPYLVDCDQPDCPVGNVNYFEAMDFANALSEAQHLPNCYAFEDCHIDSRWGMMCKHVRSTTPTVYDCEGYRLPTDAEWEYAARAGTTTAFYTGDIINYHDGAATGNVCRVEPNLEPIAWYCANSGDPWSTHPVMQKAPNNWGIYDLLGNAGEWLNDRYKGLGYGTEPIVDPDGVPTEDNPMTAGGFANMWPTGCRVAMRFEATPDSRDAGVGFRLVRTLRDNQ
jgi:sulfatase modifying factor 1